MWYTWVKWWQSEVDGSMFRLDPSGREEDGTLTDELDCC